MIRTIRVVLSFPVIKFFFHHLLEKIGVPLKKNQNSVSSVYKKKIVLHIKKTKVNDNNPCSLKERRYCYTLRQKKNDNEFIVL